MKIRANPRNIKNSEVQNMTPFEELANAIVIQAAKDYYFEGLTDVEIGKQLNISRSTVQYRRTSSFEQLKKYLEENADEWIEW